MSAQARGQARRLVQGCAQGRVLSSVRPFTKWPMATLATPVALLQRTRALSASLVSAAHPSHAAGTRVAHIHTRSARIRSCLPHLLNTCTRLYILLLHEHGSTPLPAVVVSCAHCSMRLCRRQRQCLHGSVAWRVTPWRVAWPGVSERWAATGHGTRASGRLPLPGRGAWPLCL